MPSNRKRRRQSTPQYILDMRHVLNTPAPGENEPKETESQATMRRYKDESLPKFLAMLRSEEDAWQKSRVKRVKKTDAGADRCLQIIRDLLGEWGAKQGGET